MKRATDAITSAQLDPSPESAHAWMARMSKPFVPRLSTAHWLEPKNKIAVPMSRPTSPTRTVKNALSAEWLLYASSHQCPISMNEQRPMISQPKISWTMFDAITMTSIPLENSVNAAKKCV